MDRWLGMDAFYAAIKKTANDADTVAKEVVATGSAMVTREAQGNFVGSHAKGQPHVGGDQPNVVTGQTRRSIRPDPVMRIGLFEWGTAVGPTVAWGRALELGYLARRGYPYFQPGVDKVTPQLRGISEAAWARFLA